MKKQVLLVSRLNEESTRIKKDFLKSGKFYLETATTSNQAIERLSSQKVDLVVLNMDTFTPKKLKLAEDMRVLGYNSPLLLLAQTILPDSFNHIANMHSTVLLEKPYEQKDLSGISQKLIEGRPCPQRVYRRFYTNEVAEIELYNKTGTNIPSKIRNLSKGGAFLEYQGDRINVGDVVRLAIELREVSRFYEMNGRVVWSVETSPWGNDPGIGIEFIQSKDVYSNLLKKM